MVRLDSIASRVLDQSGGFAPAGTRAGRADGASPPDRRPVHVVTLVGAVVTNEDAVRRRVRLTDRTGGPVLPPRRRGVPEDGWDQRGVELVVAPGETRALGYATRGEPVDPPLVVEKSERLS